MHRCYIVFHWICTWNSLGPNSYFVSFSVDGMAFEETWFFISACKLVGNTKWSYCSSEASFQRWISRQLEVRTQINPPKGNPVRMRAKTKNWYVLYFQDSFCCCYVLIMQTNYDIYNNIGVPCVCQLILYISLKPRRQAKMHSHGKKKSNEKYL